MGRLDMVFFFNAKATSGETMGGRRAPAPSLADPLISSDLAEHPPSVLNLDKGVRHGPPRA